MITITILMDYYFIFTFICLYRCVLVARDTINTPSYNTQLLSFLRLSARTLTLTTIMNTNPNQLLLYKLYFTMSISNWLVFGVRARQTITLNLHKHRPAPQSFLTV